MNLRLMIVLILATCGVCIGPFSAYGEDLVANNVIIRAGGNTNFPPYEFVDKNGNPAGYNVDLYRAIAKVMGIQVRFSMGPWHEIINDLQSNKVDILMGLAYTQERTSIMDFSPPHNLITLSIFGREGASKVKSINELRSKKVIVMRSGMLHDYVTKEGLGSAIVPVDTYADGLRLLASGKCDYALVPTLTGLYLAKELGLKNIKKMNEMQEVLRSCSAVKKDNVELLSTFNTGLAILKQTGEYQEIRDKWLGVLEPRGIPLKDIIKMGFAVGFIVISLLCVSIVWSRMLKKQVNQRTTALSLEVMERQRAEAALRSNQEQLIQASKMAAIGTLVSGVAHEINNPNGLILLNMTMLCEMYADIRDIMEEKLENEGDYTVGKWRYSEIRENLPELYAEALDASKRIGFIVEDLKNFSRRDSSSFEDAFDLNSAVKTAIRLVDASIKRSTDAFQVTFADGLPAIRGNLQRIEQVIVNLIVNACQSLPDRHKSISVITRHDVVNHTVQLEVTDEGVGIPSDQLHYVADPFYTTKREQGGTGLGLSVSNAIVNDHHGSLTLTSTVGKGTTAILALPVPENGGVS